jgi:GT2 family glycosyltransferase
VSAAVNATATVIVPTVAGGDRLGRLLDSLSRQTQQARTIVVDNAAPDGAVAPLVSTHVFAEHVRLEENAGFARAVNLAAALSGEDVLVLVNDDCVCEPRFVEELVAAIRPAEGVVMAAGVLLDAHDPARIDTAGMELDGTLLVFDYLNGAARSSLGPDTPAPIGPCAAAAAFDRDAFTDAGGFDENLFAYWEDVDLVLRLARTGARCALAREAVGTHEHSATLGSGSSRKNYLVGFGRGYVLRKWSVLRSPARALQVLLGDSVVCAGQLVLDRNAAGARGRLEGYRAAALVESYGYPEEVVPAALWGPVPRTLGSRLRRRLRLRARR